MAKKYDFTALKAHLLRPDFLDTAQSLRLDQLHDTKTATARLRHLALLENYSHEDVAHLMACLQATK
jgi:hypothetical protein